MGSPRKIGALETKRWLAYFTARNDEGHGVARAAKDSGVPIRSAYRFEAGDQRSGGVWVAKMFGIAMVGGVMVNQPLDPVAEQALEDFELFRRRYFGRISRPWQIRAAEDVMRYLATEHREFVVDNVAPGSGKSALFTHDIPVFLVAGKRGIRIMLGSRTEDQARKYLRRIKNTLERETPMRAEPDDYDRGMAIDAEGCVAIDYTAFKPPDRTDVWTSTQLNVRQLDGTTRGEKEPTFSAYGFDSGYLGDRVDVAIWDDLVDKKNTRVHDARVELFDKWDTEAQSRLERGGLIVLQGQRIAHNDLYRHNIDKRQGDGTPKYNHIVYKAHYDELCKGHEPGEQPSEDMAWPVGCLLDPWRLPWVGPDGLETLKGENRRMFDVLYQQEDGDASGGLVEREWIMGGTDRFGYEAPGCLDHERALGVVPEMLTGYRGFSVVTVDPSPAEYWGVLWTVYDNETQTWYDIDICSERMSTSDFLTMDIDTGVFSGLLVDWHRRAIEQRCPLRYVVFEQAAAQRFAMQRPDWQRWQTMTDVPILPHDTTGSNKLDPVFGVESLSTLYRTGRRRMPWSGPAARLAFAQMIEELQVWDGSKGNRDDTVMSAWFGKLAGERLWEPGPRRRSATFPRPADMRATAARGGYERGLAGWR